MSETLAPLLARPSPEAARVLLCDDSAVIRGAIARMLNADPTIHVAARVANGRAALEAVGREHFDVAVLDIEMPEMDGLTALPLLLRADPRLRVIMASTLTTRGADIALRALRLGAADYVPKPSVAAIADDSFRRELLAKVKGLARLRRHAVATATPPGAPRPVMGTAAAPTTVRPAARERPLLVAVGSSTGGPQALFTLVQGLGTGLKVPVVITQHMPAAFTPILADHLTRLGATPCAEARDGEPIEAGRIYLAPGDRHLLVEGRPGALRARLSDAAPENFCRPSVDPMLRSATLACSGRVLVVMLTGMGHDGREGTRAVIEAGGTALAQDEASSVVWGMPGAVAQAGLCHRVLPLPAIAPRVLDLLRDAGKGP
ncbi:Protein-glutamate methylesterase/protein-glutamine glutaminase of group 2 operon [Rhodovastum atsumiense]|uniref:protein-glutamate methylesterase/protein-glutamine glutaminase n=1 Tax=Rhodovastum atsumiense TaxID=504468 RepID=UPI001EF0FB18|nr:chemotaxis response regulator protein-glutamate methylesterase [Rhodovastum atsumiense]CAH2604011.1 Protein-glutamate methylesterase/protein-glutamine glutaminase of group 2 operon [Rhodovastum atsumiense]